MRAPLRRTPAVTSPYRETVARGRPALALLTYSDPMPRRQPPYPGRSRLATRFIRHRTPRGPGEPAASTASRIPGQTPRRTLSWRSPRSIPGRSRRRGRDVTLPREPNPRPRARPSRVALTARPEPMVAGWAAMCRAPTSEETAAGREFAARGSRHCPGPRGGGAGRGYRGWGWPGGTAGRRVRDVVTAASRLAPWHRVAVVPGPGHCVTSRRGLPSGAHPRRSPMSSGAFSTIWRRSALYRRSDPIPR